MIPKTLVMEGIYSYRERVTIDFEPLTAARLFGIFGPVGSGKSTVLEAISLALFGDTTRLNSKGDNRNYNLLNLRSDRLWIDFEFVNYDGDEYRFTVEARRRGTDFEKVGTMKRSGYRRENGEWYPLPTVSGETVLGVSYDNFRRTVIIPQGRFQEFLQLGVKDRTEMLKDLFGLDRFDLYRGTKNLLDRAVQRITALEAAIAETPADTDHQLTELAAELEQATARRTAAVEQRNAAVTWRDRLEGVAELLREQDALTAAEQALASRAPAIESDRTRLTHLETVRSQLLVPFRERERAVSALAEETKRRDEAVAACTPLREERERREAQVATLETAEQMRSEREARRDLLGRALAYVTDRAELHRIRAATTDEREQQAATQAKLAEYTETEMQFNESLTSVREGLPDHATLRAAESVKRSRDELTACRDGLHRLVVDMNKLVAAARDAGAVVELPSDVSAAEPDTERDTGSDIELYIDTALATLTEWIATVRRERHREEHLAEVALTLRAGEPCPVCGSRDHPAPIAGAAEPAAATSATPADAAESTPASPASPPADLDAEQFEGELHRLAAAYRAARERERAGEAELQQLRRSVDPDSDGRRPAVHIDEIADDLDALWARHQELDTLLQQQATLRVDRDRLQQETAERESRLATENGRIAEIERRLGQTGDELPAELRDLDDPTVVEAEIAEITDKLNRLSSDLHSAREHLTAARSAEDRAVATEQERRASHARAEEAVRSAEDALAAAMERIGVAPEEDLPALMEAAATVDDVRQRIEEYDGAIRDARSQRRTLEEKLREQTPPELDQSIDAALEDARARVTAAESRIQETDTAIGELTNRRSVLEGQRERRAALTAERDELMARKTNIDTLLRLFTGNRFVTFVAQVFLEQLVAVANDRFRRLTRNRLELVLRGDHEFEVIDFLNGGRRRSVKTLSGGQTFQAALCLALALVDSIDRAGGTDQPGFFFLDEGFGSLDEEALQDVFATLTDLRRENRIVGVISHVESLQQEIDAFLRVRIDQERGSEIVSGYT